MIKLGVIGKPSDWLIASDVEDNKAKEVFDVSGAGDTVISAFTKYIILSYII